MDLVTGPALHERVIREQLLEARRTVWIATADLEDMHVRKGTRWRPVLEVFNEMAGRGVTFRIVHAKVPSRPFRDTLERFEHLYGGALELQVCPRSHWKIVLVDQGFVYLGSANFTGAGLGGKSPDRRNFELGTVSTDPAVVGQVTELFDAFWMGTHCPGCSLRDLCPDPIAG